MHAVAKDTGKTGNLLKAVDPAIKKRKKELKHKLTLIERNSLWAKDGANI